MAWKDIMVKIEPAEEIVPDGTKLKAKGVFDAEDLYVELHRWFTHFGYDWKETRYLSTDMPNGSKLTEISWKCSRIVDEYCTFVMDMHLKLTTTEVEAVIENAKKKMQNGTAEFRFRGMMNKNIAMWQNKPMGRLLHIIYERVLIRKRMLRNIEILKAEANRLFDEIKNYLGIR